MPILGILASSTQVAAGDFESIATQTVTGSTASSVEFTSIPSTYTHLQIRANMLCNGQQNIRVQFNSDTGSNYAWHELFGQGSSASAGASSSTSFMQIGYVQASDANITGAFVAEILDYANTNKHKTMRSLNGSDGNTAGYILLRSGLWQSTNAITSIKIYPAGSNLFKQYSHFALYGIKSA